MVSSTALLTLAALAAISPALAYDNAREFSEDVILAREITDLLAREPSLFELDARGGEKDGHGHKIHFHKGHGQKGRGKHGQKGDIKRDILDLFVRNTPAATPSKPQPGPQTHRGQQGHKGGSRGGHRNGKPGHKLGHGGKKGQGRKHGLGRHGSKGGVRGGLKGGNRNGRKQHKGGAQRARDTVETIAELFSRALLDELD
ncbi:hypothetical protein BDY19DRAFT_996651 [Irpex rosettiformis]|uniref:Uncharacterized protein n=1 Tax=Irpex rosettiformis TaxID=378272 RepID=A0ACB8TU68_9APHY|nr:hypothetical protein BDY19DRAFT_996651 [Irpex rosettiformis]